MSRHVSVCCLLLGLLAAGAAGQYFDFYPNASGDGSSWTNANNWVRFNNYDLNKYPPYPDNAYYSGAYPNMTTIAHIAYIRDQASVTIASGESIRMSEVDVGGIYYYDDSHPVLPRTKSTLTVNGGTLNCEQYLFVGGVYDGDVILKPGSQITTLEFRVAFPDASVGWSPTSTFRVEGGYFSGHRSEVGNNGMTGYVEQTGGTAKYNWLNLGYGDSGGAGTGIYNLYGGLLAPTEFAIGNSTYAGTGHLNLMGGTVSFNGTSPTPGGFFGVNRGSVKLGKGFHCDVTGSSNDCRYVQGSLGSLIVELKNIAEFGYMSVARDVTLGGTFQAMVAPGASWNIGDTFEVLRSRNSTISATQAFLDSYNLVSDRYFNIGLDSDGLILTAIKSPGASQPHPGDANNDGAVNVGDLGILAGNWGQSPRTWAQGNFTTPDTVVDVGDLGVLAGNWGWTAPPSLPAPEPASLMLLSLGGLALLRRR